MNDAGIGFAAAGLGHADHEHVKVGNVAWGRTASRPCRVTGMQTEVRRTIQGCGKPCRGTYPGLLCPAPPAQMKVLRVSTVCLMLSSATKRFVHCGCSRCVANNPCHVCYARRYVIGSCLDCSCVAVLLAPAQHARLTDPEERQSGPPASVPLHLGGMVH
jgi:hypothetical protein